MRILLAALAAVLLLAAPADAARLRGVTKLKATAAGDGVRLTWKDRATGETRYEIRRRGLHARVARNASRYTDRAAKAGRTYRYSVRPCRGRLCAPERTVRFTLSAARQPAPP